MAESTNLFLSSEGKIFLRQYLCLIGKFFNMFHYGLTVVNLFYPTAIYVLICFDVPWNKKYNKQRLHCRKLQLLIAYMVRKGPG